MGLSLDNLNEKQYQLRPLLTGEGNMTIGGYPPLQQHLQAALQRDHLKWMEMVLRQQVSGGMGELQDDLGIVQMLLGKEQAAIASFSQAIAAGSLEAFYPLGKLYLQQSQNPANPVSKWNAAVDQLRQAVQLDAQNAGAWLCLGKALLGLIREESLQQVSKAYSAYLAADAPLGEEVEINAFLISQDPERQRKEQVRIGQESLADGDYVRSIAAFEKAIQLGDKDSHYFLGTAFEAAGNYARALDAYQEAYKLEVRPHEVALRLGRTLVALRSDQALNGLTIDALERLKDGMGSATDTSSEMKEIENILKSLKGIPKRSKTRSKSQ